jgi:hypothetical protein
MLQALFAVPVLVTELGIFAESPKRIELLNEAAGTFFYIIQEVLLNEVQVCLSKLTDPAKSGKYNNLSLEQLQSQLNQHGELIFPIEQAIRSFNLFFRRMIEVVLNGCFDLCRTRRFKHCAHFASKGDPISCWVSSIRFAKADNFQAVLAS